jgi:DNA processing protein
VTSAQSAGCHRIIREWAATCVTRATEIIELLSPLSVPDALSPDGGADPDAWPQGHGLSSRDDGALFRDDGALFRHDGGMFRDGDMVSRDNLDADSARVLDALPTRGGAGTSTIAVEAGVDLDTVLRCLGELAVLGFIERCDRGWRLRKH